MCSSLCCAVDPCWLSRRWLLFLIVHKDRFLFAFDKWRDSHRRVQLLAQVISWNRTCFGVHTWAGFSFIFCFLGCTVPHAGSLFPDQGLNPCPLQWERRFFTIWPPGKPNCDMVTQICELNLFKKLWNCSYFQVFECIGELANFWSFNLECWVR